LNKEIRGGPEILRIVGEARGFIYESGKSGKGAEEADENNYSELAGDVDSVFGQRPQQTEQQAADDIYGGGTDWEFAVYASLDEAAESITAQCSCCTGETKKQYFGRHKNFLFFY